MGTDSDGGDEDGDSKSFEELKRQYEEEGGFGDESDDGPEASGDRSDDDAAEASHTDSDADDGGASFEELKEQYQEEGGFGDEDEDDGFGDEDEDEVSEGGVEDDEASGDDGGTSFEELKEQYQEEGGFGDEAGDEAKDETPGGDGRSQPDRSSADSQPTAEESTAEEPMVEEPTADTDTDKVKESSPDRASRGTERSRQSSGIGQSDQPPDERSSVEREPRQSTSAPPTNQTAETSETSAQPTPQQRTSRPPVQAAGDGRPYLVVLPEGYVQDRIVLDWMEFLIDEGGSERARDAIDYYERIGWIGERASEQLHAFLDGFQSASDDGAALTMDHHARSLEYVARISGNVHELAFDRGDDRRWLRP